MGMEQFVIHNIVAVVREALILGPLAAFVWWWRRRAEAEPERSASRKQVRSSD
jgi:hypothetical protein